jgi:hypothetical protein
MKLSIIFLLNLLIIILIILIIIKIIIIIIIDFNLQITYMFFWVGQVQGSGGSTRMPEPLLLDMAVVKSKVIGLGR